MSDPLEVSFREGLEQGRQEAQAEIERLRHNEAFHVERAAAQDVEIERLRGIVEFGETASRQQREGFQAEIERLRSCSLAYQSGNALGAAHKEIERLKAALREIAAAESSLGWKIARAALEGSDEALFPTKKICPECGQPMREGGYCDHIPF